MHDPAALGFREEKLNEAQTFGQASRADKFAYAEKLAREKDGMRNVLSLWLSYWRDVFLCAEGSSAPPARATASGGVCAVTPLAAREGWEPDPTFSGPLSTWAAGDAAIELE